MTGQTGLDWVTAAGGHGSFAAERREREKESLKNLRRDAVKETRVLTHLVGRTPATPALI